MTTSRGCFFSVLVSVLLITGAACGDDDGAANRDPLTVDDTATTTQGAEVEIALLDNDTDPDGDSLVVSSITDPSSGSVTFNPAGTAAYTPDASFVGTATFDYTVSDGRGGTAVGHVSIIVCADDDGDEVCDSEDDCFGHDDSIDADADGVPDGCDVCEGHDDSVDADTDGVPDGCDICEGLDDSLDADTDGVPDGCDICAGHDDSVDADTDGVPDGCDICAGHDDSVDADADGVPDGCDACPGHDDSVDADADGVPDGCDICTGHDDSADADTDGVPDGCDACPGHDDSVDADADGVPDGCDICAGHDDSVDADTDGVPDGCDICAGHDDSADTDLDTVPDGCDMCAGQDDTVDIAQWGFPNCAMNYLTNGQFITDVTGWAAEGLSTNAWSAVNGAGVMSSGSIEVTNECTVNNCVRGSRACADIGAGVMIRAFVEHLTPSGQSAAGSAHITLVFRDGPCAGASAFISSVTSPVSSTIGTWTTISTASLGVSTPVGTQSVQMVLSTTKTVGTEPSFQVIFDNALLLHDT